MLGLSCAKFVYTYIAFAHAELCGLQSYKIGYTDKPSIYNIYTNHNLKYFKLSCLASIIVSPQAIIRTSIIKSTEPVVHVLSIIVIKFDFTALIGFKQQFYTLSMYSDSSQTCFSSTFKQRMAIRMRKRTNGERNLVVHS